MIAAIKPTKQKLFLTLLASIVVYFLLIFDFRSMQSFNLLFIWQVLIIASWLGTFIIVDTLVLFLVSLAVLLLIYAFLVYLLVCFILHFKIKHETVTSFSKSVVKELGNIIKPR